jgi:Tol biopolymer transport system component
VIFGKTPPRVSPESGNREQKRGTRTKEGRPVKHVAYRCVCGSFLLLMAACIPAARPGDATRPSTPTAYEVKLPPKWTQTLTATLPEASEIPTGSESSVAGLYAGTPGPDDRRILFIAEEDCSVLSVSTAGGGATPVTTAPIEDCIHPSLSPVGGRIAYSTTGTPPALMVANVDGSESRVVAKDIGAWLHEPTLINRMIWSPDGKHLAVFTDYPALLSEDVYLLPPDGSAQAQNIFPGYVSWVDWSSDSKWLAFLVETGHQGVLDIFPVLYRISDKTRQIVFLSGACVDGCAHLEWARDSRSISFLTYNNVGVPSDYAFGTGKQAMVTAHLTNGAETAQEYLPLPFDQPSSEVAASWNPFSGIRWAPDMRSFLALRYSGNTLVLFSPSGEVRNEVRTPADEPIDFGWSPDGEWVYILYPGSDGSTVLEIVRLDGTEPRVLARGVDPGSIVWME